MSNNTNNILQEYTECKSKLHSLTLELFKKTTEVLSWENENLGKNQKTYKGWTCEDVEIEEDSVYFYVSDSWGYGGYEKTDFCIPRYKLISDDWRKEALKEYKEKLEEERIAKELEAQTKAIELETKERLEYLRLKAKYEK